MSQKIDELELRRRISGITLAELARRSRIPYYRLWSSLSGRQLTEDELKRLDATLTRAEHPVAI